MSDSLAHIVIKVPKEHSSYTYFTLEAHDGMCFYSTLEHKEGDKFRLLDIKATKDFEEALLHTLNFLSTKFSVEILKHELIEC